MKYTFRQYCDIENGSDRLSQLSFWFDSIFNEMELAPFKKGLYILSGNRWVFQIVGKKIYFSYVFIAQEMMNKFGVKPFQITEYVHTQLQARNYHYKTLECKFLPEW
jgi:hypothetical protein